jgi:hypothetical protein
MLFSKAWILCPGNNVPRKGVHIFFYLYTFIVKANVMIVVAVMVVIVWYLDLQLPMLSVPIATNVVSLNPAH